MMISLIVVALVGIGFTRLTMLALELRDNYDDAGEEPVDIGRKRLEVHNKMVQLAKPPHVVIKGENRYEAPNTASDDAYSVVIAGTEKLSAGFSALFSYAEAPKTKDDDVTSEDDANVTITQQATDTTAPLDPTDVCTICFEKAKNAVLLGCGHGGVCYSCSIDVCVTSGHCPFCRSEISQIVTVAIGTIDSDDDGNQLLPVIGPK